MTNLSFRVFRACALCGLVLMMVACATRPAPDFRGRWKPLNQFADTPVALPLSQAYVYSASPMDRTLKSLLTRWARASKHTLSYLHSSDFTLYGPVQDLQTTNLEQAISALNAAYAPYGATLSLEAGQIIVRHSQIPALAESPEARP